MGAGKKTKDNQAGGTHSAPAGRACACTPGDCRAAGGDNGIAVEFHTEITPGIIREKEVYLILNSQYDLGLIELVRRARELNYRVGRDISIISYNESPINEIILNGLTTISTDFRQMGVLVARMILDKTPAKIKCDFQMIRRNTF